MGKNKSKLFGFTLIEMLIVVGVISLLLAIIIPRFSKIRLQAKYQSNIANAQKMIDIIETYKTVQGSSALAASTTYGLGQLVNSGDPLTNFIASDSSLVGPGGSGVTFRNPFTGATYADSNSAAAGQVLFVSDANKELDKVTIYGETSSTVVKEIDYTP
ncbi:MAG: type II secretion system protein [bacterium]